MIRRPTVVYIMILVAVLAVFLYLNFREPPAVLEATPGPTGEVSYLFSSQEGAPTSILIRAKSGETVELARNAQEAWTLKQPIETGAEQGSSEAAASQVLTMRLLEKTVDVDPELVGLTDPAYTLAVKFKNGTERTISIGVVTPTESGYYVQDSGGGRVAIITKNSVDALVGLLARPPYLETPTPSPVSSGAGTATTAALSTP